MATDPILRCAHSRHGSASSWLLAVVVATGGGCATPPAEDQHAATFDSGPGPATRPGSVDRPRPDDRVALTEAAVRTAMIRMEPVRVEAGTTESSGLEVPGQIEFDPRRVALVSPRTSGRVERLLVVEGDRVRAEQAVAQLYSPAFIAAQQEFLQATRRARVLQGSVDEEGGRALARAARQRLVLLGATDHTMEVLEAGGEPQALLTLTAPLSGSILESHVLPGSLVETGAPLFKIADLSEVDAVAAVPERALPLVHIGQTARVSIAAFPGMEFSGHVERLRDELDPETRTVRAAIHVPNPAGRLRPGMFASIRLAVRLGVAVGNPTGRGASVPPVLTIPESAVLTDGRGRFVFVEIEARTFERRRVEVISLAPAGSSATPGRVAVREGLKAGERVVVNGAFTLKSELAKAGLAEDEH